MPNNIMKFLLRISSIIVAVSVQDTKCSEKSGKNIQLLGYQFAFDSWL